VRRGYESVVDALGVCFVLVFGERGTQGARGRVLASLQAQLVGRYVEQGFVPGLYPPTRALGDREEMAKIWLKAPVRVE
jgi:hypothetical protein